MSTPGALYHLVRADFWERVRRYSFLVVLGATVYLGYAFIAGHIALRLDRYCGVYNSAWVGLLTTIAATFFLSVAGFYIVKNTLERDRRTGVGQIIAATPVGKLLYVSGKALSNLAVFAIVTAILILAALAMQLLRGEDLQVEVWPLVSPFLLILLPAMAVMAALAVLFETIPWLRGGFGNVAYFFLWSLGLAQAFEHPGPFVDLLGIDLAENALQVAARSMGLDYQGGVSIEMVKFMPATPVRWEGILWTPERVWARLYWVGVASVLVLGAAALFDRFDPAGGPLHRLGLSLQRPRSGPLNWWQKRRHSSEPRVTPGASSLACASPHVQLVPLTAAATRFRFGPVLLAELRLMLKGQRWWWYVVTLGLVAASLLAPLEAVREIVLPLAWIWPVLIWSAMGVREVYHRTEQLVFSTTHPLRRQLPATWLAGVIVAVLAGGGGAARLILDGDWLTLLAWVVGALFIPTLALALGVWSGTSKLFEAVYVTLWYIGPANQIPALDFMGATEQSVATGVPWYYLGSTMMLLVLAALGRWRQLRM